MRGISFAKIISGWKERQEEKETANAKSAIVASPFYTRLLLLRSNLREVQKVQDPLLRLVSFLGIMAVEYDKGFPEFECDTNEIASALRMHVLHAGRALHGINRTKTGEVVTVNNVYLGNVYGLTTRPVAEWLHPSHKMPLPGSTAQSAYGIVTKQAESFMESHIPSLIKLIDTLERVTEGSEESRTQLSELAKKLAPEE